MLGGSCPTFINNSADEGEVACFGEKAIWAGRFVNWLCPMSRADENCAVVIHIEVSVRESREVSEGLDALLDIGRSSP